MLHQGFCRGFCFCSGVNPRRVGQSLFGTRHHHSFPIPLIICLPLHFDGKIRVMSALAALLTQSLV